MPPRAVVDEIVAALGPFPTEADVVRLIADRPLADNVIDLHRNEKKRAAVADMWRAAMALRLALVG